MSNLLQNGFTTERIDGYPLARAPPEQIRELIPVGVELFLCQLLDVGSFHADPHPGRCCNVAFCLSTMH